MPKVTACGRTLTCDRGGNLRQVLLENGIQPHNGNARWINCRGIGTCGTCAVEVVGEVSQVNWKDKARRSLPPHNPDRNLRLACQTRVLGDVTVIKYEGFWGQEREVRW